MYSFGLVLKQIKGEFQVEDSKANLLSSLNTGFLFCSGPIVAGLANQFGCRVVVVGGAIVTSLMYVLTAYAPSIYVQMVTYGVVGGISTGCTYIASIIVVAQYFEKKRGIATGITMAGSGVGGFAFAPILEYLIGKFGWKYAVVIMGAIILQCAVLGCLLRPLKAAEPKKKNKK
jgi:MCP family monocarboxylic acid transporter-like MFS transporter 12